MELKDVERIEALASDPHVVTPTAWHGFYLVTANGWTRDYVAAVLAAAPELLKAARQGIIAVDTSAATELLDAAMDAWQAWLSSDDETRQRERERVNAIIETISRMTGLDTEVIYERAQRRMIERHEQAAASEIE